MESELAKPLFGLVLFCLLYLTYQIGLINMVAEAIFSPFVPD